MMVQFLCLSSAGVNLHSAAMSAGSCTSNGKGRAPSDPAGRPHRRSPEAVGARAVGQANPLDYTSSY